MFWMVRTRRCNSVSKHFYFGLLLSVMFSPSHKPVMLTGARRDGVIDIRQQMDLELVPRRRSSGVTRRSKIADDILLAAQLGQKLDAIRAGDRARRAVAVFPGRCT